MPTYKAPVNDVLFLLNDVFHLERFANLAGFADASPDAVAAILEQASKFCEELLVPLNPVGDRQGCRRLDDGSVVTPNGFRDAYRRLIEGGFIGISVPAEFGGLGLPGALTEAVNEFLVVRQHGVCDVSGADPGGHRGAADPRHRRAEVRYLPKLVSGEWTATMNLTEAQCGTDLGLIRTKAVPQNDGSFRITGTKIFISAGEHDLADNIVHLVLARIAGAPPGTRGLSLFLVPKFIPDFAGAPGVPTRCRAGPSKKRWASTAMPLA